MSLSHNEKIPPKLSIIIGYRDWGLKRLSLVVQSHLASINKREIEIIISDYGSKDSQSVIDTMVPLGVKVVRTETARKWNRSAALNAGIIASCAQFIITTDTDIIISPNCYSEILKLLSSNPDALYLIQCRNLPVRLGVQEIEIMLQELGKTGWWHELERISTIRPRWGTGGFAAFAKEKFFHINGYDERMQIWGGEDNDFALRFRRAGYPLRWLPASLGRIYHIWHHSSQDKANDSDIGAISVKANKKILELEQTSVRNLKKEWDLHRSLPTISILIASPIKPDFLRRSLLSLQAQTFKNFEVVALSCGGTIPVNKDAFVLDGIRFRNISVPEKEIKRQFLFGLKYIVGRYVIFLESGDILMPTCLENHISAAIEGSGATCCGWDYQLSIINSFDIPDQKVTSSDRGATMDANAPLLTCLMLEKKIFRVDSNLDALINAEDLLLFLNRNSFTISYTQSMGVLRLVNPQFVELNRENNSSTKAPVPSGSNCQFGAYNMIKKTNKGMFQPKQEQSADFTEVVCDASSYIVSSELVSNLQKIKSLENIDALILTGESQKVNRIANWVPVSETMSALIELRERFLKLRSSPLRSGSTSMYDIEGEDIGRRKVINPMISVVIPVYNTEKYLEKCLDSVLSQSFTDFEVLCVDDCSPDNSWKLLKKYSLLDSRIRIIKHKENLGLGGARNTAILAARGVYIASVDSDDYMLPNMLERLFEEASSSGADIVACGFQRIDENGDLLKAQKPSVADITNINNSIDIFTTTNPAFWNKLWKKSLFIDNNIYFPNYVYYQDLATTPRLLAKAKKIKLINDVLYMYLIRRQSATYSYSAKHLLDYVKVFSVLRTFLVQNGLLSRYEKSFRGAMDQGWRFHSQNVVKSDIGKQELTEYLKLSLMLKRMFEGFESELSLYDQPGLLKALTEAENDNVIGKAKNIPMSVLVKTFCRPSILKRFLTSVGEYQKKWGVQFTEIIIGDDSNESEKKANEESIDEIIKLYPILIVRYESYEYDIGLSAARNRMVDAAISDYILLCDDDFIFDLDCNLGLVFEMIKSNHIDILGGWLKNKYNLITGEFEYWGSMGHMVETDNELYVYLNEDRNRISSLQYCDFILNYFIAKVSVLKDIRWDDNLKIEEHYEFFYRIYKSSYVTAFTDSLFVKHTNERPNNSKLYNSHRFAKERWTPALFNSVEKLNKERRIVNRWRSDHFISWQTDCIAKTDIQKRVELKESIRNQCVPVQRLTPEFENNFFGYYDIPSASQDGRYILSHMVLVHDRLPTDKDPAKLMVFDCLNGEKRQIGVTNAWCFQQGALLQFMPESDEEVVYNIFDQSDKMFKSLIMSLNGEVRQTISCPLAAISPDGKRGVSINFSRMYDYRPGYGYSNLPDPHTNEVAPADDGIFLVNLITGEKRLLISYQRIWKQFIHQHFPNHENSKLVVNHITFSPEGKKLVILLRVFSDQAPFPTFTLVYDIDDGNLRKVFGFTSHYHWKDEEILLLSGSDVYNRKRMKKIELYELNIKTGNRKILDEEFFVGDGHCSYSPDRSLVLYDSYSSVKNPYRKLQVYDLKTRHGIDVGHFFSDPNLYGGNVDVRCDLHPRWTSDSSKIIFDSTHEGFRAIYCINVNDVRDALGRYRN